MFWLGRTSRTEDEEADAMPVVAPAPMAPSGRRVVLVDRHRDNPVEACAPSSGDFGGHIVMDGRAYSHVDEAADGTWRYAPV